MRIVMKTTSAGPEGTRRAGQSYEVSADEGKALIAGGYAEPSRSVPAETADGNQGDENAERKPSGNRGRGRKGADEE